MQAKPVIPREQAIRDVYEAVAYYLSEVGEAVAIGFIDALEKAYGQIGPYPASGISQRGCRSLMPCNRLLQERRMLTMVRTRLANAALLHQLEDCKNDCTKGQTNALDPEQP